MKRTFFELKHKVDGELRLAADDEHVYFSCAWPFDLKADEWDEWTVSSNTFLLREYRSKVKQLADGAEVVVRGVESGCLCLRKIDENHIEFRSIESTPTSNSEFHIVLNA